MQKKYVMVPWPECQAYMDHPRWNECYLVHAREDQQYHDSTYFIPLDLVEEVETNEIFSVIQSAKQSSDT